MTLSGVLNLIRLWRYARKSAGLIGNQRQNLALFPVAIPAVIQLERSQGCQTVTTEETPLPSTDLLAFSDQEVIGLFSPTTTNVALLEATLAIIGNPGLAGLEIGDQAIHRVCIVCSRAIASEEA